MSNESNFISSGVPSLIQVINCQWCKEEISRLAVWIESWKVSLFVTLLIEKRKK